MTEVLTEGLIGQKLGKPFMKEVLDIKRPATHKQRFNICLNTLVKLGLLQIVGQGKFSVI